VSVLPLGVASLFQLKVKVTARINIKERRKSKMRKKGRETLSSGRVQPPTAGSFSEWRLQCSLVLDETTEGGSLPIGFYLRINPY
jgi:hypothetical protein